MADQRHFSIRLTAREMSNANRLMLRHHPVRRFAPIVIVLVAIALGGLLALSARHFHPELNQRQLFAVFAKGLAGTLMFLGLQYVWLFGTMLRAASDMELEGEGHVREIAYRFDGAGLTATDDAGSTTWAWSQFKRPVEDPDWLLLRRSIATFCAIPKSRLDPAMLIALKQALATAQNSTSP